MVLQKSVIVAMTLMLSACSSTFWYTREPHQVAFDDLNYFKWDCAHAPEQKAFLEQQYRMTSPFPVDASRRAIISKMLNEMHTYCPSVQRQASCTHVREDMPSGSAQAVVCNQSGRLRPLERPVVNRWDPLVDTK